MTPTAPSANTSISGDADEPCVLLVDDNPTNLQILVQGLTGQGLTLLIARSGEEALSVAARARPGVILLDINMPGIGGFETCRRLKADPETRDCVVVFVSARSDTHAKLEGFALGAADYIAKPFDLDEVLARVRTHLASYRRHRELQESNTGLAQQAHLAATALDEEAVRAMIRAGETDRFELKSTLRWNLKADRAGKEIENAWLKTVVAFLNTNGGVLVIGVADDGTVLGIEPDRFADGDRYLLHTNNLMRSVIGSELTPYVDFGLVPLDGKAVLAVVCRPSPQPVFMRRDGDEAFYVRIGPGSRKLLPSEVLAYVENRRAAGTPEGPRVSPLRSADGDGDADEPERILVVDDDTRNVDVLLKTLEGLGHELITACSGSEALEVAERDQPALILLDIMMPPGIDGYETCRRLKAHPRTRDQAVIFMSALSETRDKVRGLEVGAADYITKPFEADEVIARVGTHLTIQRLQRSLARRNDELHAMNVRVTKELRAAAGVQQSLLPRDLPEMGGACFAWKYQPCDELAGDGLGIFALDEGRAGMYVLDVTGHGVPAALLSVAATHRLRLQDPARSGSGLAAAGAVPCDIVAPAVVAAELNELYPIDETDYRFFTLIYAVLDTAAGSLRYVSAGHPGPMVVRANGGVENFPSTGLPIGIERHTSYEERSIKLQRGDRVYLFSDGAFEAMDHDHNLYGVERLQQRLERSRNDSLDHSLDALREDLTTWSGGAAFSDDVSLVAAELRAPDP